MVFSGRRFVANVKAWRFVASFGNHQTVPMQHECSKIERLFKGWRGLPAETKADLTAIKFIINGSWFVHSIDQSSGACYRLFLSVGKRMMKLYRRG
jgi:hypothetical protein